MNLTNKIIKYSKATKTKMVKFEAPIFYFKSESIEPFQEDQAGAIPYKLHSYMKLTPANVTYLVKNKEIFDA